MRRLSHRCMLCTTALPSFHVHLLSSVHVFWTTVLPSFHVYLLSSVHGFGRLFFLSSMCLFSRMFMFWTTFFLISMRRFSHRCMFGRLFFLVSMCCTTIPRCFYGFCHAFLMTIHDLHGCSSPRTGSRAARTTLLPLFFLVLCPLFFLSLSVSRSPCAS